MKRREFLSLSAVLGTGCLSSGKTETQEKWSLPPCSSSDANIRVINAEMQAGETFGSTVDEAYENYSVETEYEATVSGSVKNTNPRPTVVEMDVVFRKNGKGIRKMNSDTGSAVPSGEVAQFELNKRMPEKPDSFEISISSREIDRYGAEEQTQFSDGCYVR